MSKEATSAPPTSLVTALQGRYRVERQVGEGGMATVYLAHDVRHDRRVALKVLRPELAAVVGAERFLAEIRTTANLQHPHILPLFDSGEVDGLVYYVMPFVDGESLEAQLARERQLPVDEAVRIAQGVASALQYAHEQGVVHRDIKPANILLSRKEPLVADFGIALAVSQAAGARVTETGISLGTPHYMSPEQAAGERTLDKRSDVYALGCVLYEMLVGEPPHVGPTAQSVLAKILTQEPRRVSQSRRSVASNVDAAIAKALERLPADRFDSAEAFARALGDPAFRHEPATTSFAGAPLVSAPRLGSRPIWGAAWAASVVLSAMIAGLVARRTAVTSPGSANVTRFNYVLPDGVDLPAIGPITRPIAVSPDGGSIVFIANRQLYRRALGDLDARPIPGSEEPRGLLSLFLSPDGLWIGYVASPERPGEPGILKKIPIDGGEPLPLTEVRQLPTASSWGDDGSILFGTVGGTIHRVSEDGGESEILVQSDSAVNYYGLQVLPGGTHLLTAVGSLLESEVVVQTLATGDRQVIATGKDAKYVESGHILYVVEDRLMALPFDARRLEVTGPPALVASGLRVTNVGGSANYAVSRTGVLAWIAEAAERTTDRSLLWVDRAGVAEAVPGLPRRPWRFPRISPNGQRVAASVDGDIWVYDFGRSGGLRLTQDGGDWPTWSPDGAWIAYLSGWSPGPGIDGPGQIGGEVSVLASNGSGSRQQLTRGELAAHPDDWSPDGALVLVHHHRRSIDVGVVRVADTTGVTEFVLTGNYDEAGGVFSPDGRWIAYSSTETRRPEIYITPYPGPGGRQVVSSGGGREPVWAANGELFYRSLDRRQLFSTLVKTVPELEFEEPRALFTADFVDVPGPQGVPPQAEYDVTKDGQRFLMAGSAPGSPMSRVHINVMLNWLGALSAPTP